MSLVPEFRENEDGLDLMSPPRRGLFPKAWSVKTHRRRGEHAWAATRGAGVVPDQKAATKTAEETTLREKLNRALIHIGEGGNIHDKDSINAVFAATRGLAELSKLSSTDFDDVASVLGITSGELRGLIYPEDR